MSPVLQRIKPKPMLIALCCIFLVLCMVTGTLAILEREKKIDHQIIASNVVVSPYVYFEKIIEGNIVTEECPIDKNGYFMATLDDPDAMDYAGNLRVAIKYKGVTKGYVRVHLTDMWVIKETDREGNEIETVIYQEDMNVLGAELEQWKDYRMYDNYFYYMGNEYGFGDGIIGCAAEDMEIEIPFISKLNDFYNYENGRLYLNIRAEAVQFNRIEAFWGMEKPPGID